MSESVALALEDPMRCQQLQHTIQCTDIHVAPRGQGGGRNGRQLLVGDTQLGHYVRHRDDT